MKFKLLLLTLAVVILSACASNHKSSSQYASQSLTIPIYAKLAETKSGYTFSEFSLASNSSYPWINLKSPLGNLKFEPGECSIGFAGSADLPCESYSKTKKPFSEKSFQPGMYLFRIALSPFLFGMTLFGADFDVEFDEDAFNDAIESAYSSSKLTTEKIANLEKKIFEYKTLFSNNQLETLYTNAEEFSLDLPFNSDILYLRNISHDSFDNMLSTFEDAVEKIQSSEKKIAILREEIIEKRGKIRAEEYRLELEQREIAQKKLQEEQEIKEKQKLEKYKFDFKDLKDSINSYQGFVNTYRYYDPLGYVKDTQVKITKLIEQKRIDDEKIRQQHEQQLKKKISAYRQKLASGDDSNCGLVIEVKEKVVQIQTMEGAVWIKIDQIYPSGIANCRFYNGVYQPPTGLPL